MKKILIYLSVFLTFPIFAMSQEILSPNGNVLIKFYLSDGTPTYEMSYKGKPVIKPSHLGIELANSKHASKGTKETNLMTGFNIADSKTSEFKYIDVNITKDTK